jgi:hypothetical protein
VAPRPEPGWEIEKTTIGQRQIFRLTGATDPEYSNLQFAWWAEGNDLVFYYGLAPVNEYVNSLELEENRIVKSDLWQSAFEMNAAAPEAVKLTETTRAFINLERISQIYADTPIPGVEPATTVRKLVEPTGLLGLRAIGLRSGYRGQNLVSVTRTVTESPRRGLLSLRGRSATNGFGSIEPMTTAAVKIPDRVWTLSLGGAPGRLDGRQGLQQQGDGCANRVEAHIPALRSHSEAALLVILRRT